MQRKVVSMSDSTDPDNKVNLEQQRKRAKDLRRAYREGSAHAAARIIRHLPRARGASPEQALRAPFTLSEAQFIVAREAGFANWPQLRQSAAATTDAGERLIDAALAGNDRAVDESLARDPAAVRRSIYAAVSVADTDAVAALLGADATLADCGGGRRGWKPLLYLCCSRYRPSEREPARVAIARRLLENGAAPSGREGEFLSTHGTMLAEDNELLAIEAAAGRAASPELVRVLLSAGADLKQTTVALLQAVRGGRIEVLQILLQALPAEAAWQVGWALQESVVRGRKDMARLLVEHAELPAEGALAEALRLGHDLETLEILSGRDQASGHYRRALQNAYGCAVRYGRSEAEEWLRLRGAEAARVSVTDRVLGACARGDSEHLRTLMREFHASSLAFADEDHRMLSWAMRTGHGNAVPLLLEAGADPNVADADGETPLHLAVRAGDAGLAQLLIRAGANVNARNFDGNTALDAARAFPRAKVRDLLTKCLLDAGANHEGPGRRGAAERRDANLLFERAADAVVSGEIAALRELLEGEPSLVEARSARPHRATLLHYCGANGVEEERQRTPANAPEIARMLLAGGADVNATCSLYRGGATTLGLMLSSIHPVRAGVRRQLLEVLLEAGARIDGARGTDGLSGAAASGRVDRVRAFFDRDDSVKPPTQREIQSAFQRACEFGRTAVAEFLLGHGADLRAQDGSGQTGLHLAALGGYADTARLLLDRKAPLEIENAWGATVLNHALWAAVNYGASADYVSIVKTLIDAGAKVHAGVAAWWSRQTTVDPSVKRQIGELLRGDPAS